MPIIVDARGLGCPQPVINTKKALETADTITVIVDNPTARENVSRMANSLGCTVSAEEKTDGIYLSIHRQLSEPGQLSTASISGRKTEPDIACTSGPLVTVISADQMGRGSEELGSVLIRSFMHTLGEISPIPDVIIFLNAGVKLAIKSSEVLEDLKELQAKGVRILVCGTCLNYFGLTDQLDVGMVSNMYDIAEAMFSAGKLVTL